MGNFSKSYKKVEYLSLDFNKWVKEECPLMVKKVYHYESQTFRITFVIAFYREMIKQFSRILHEMKFLNSSGGNCRQSNMFSDNVAVIKAIVCASLYPNVAVIK